MSLLKREGNTMTSPTERDAEAYTDALFVGARVFDPVSRQRFARWYITLPYSQRTIDWAAARSDESFSVTGPGTKEVLALYLLHTINAGEHVPFEAVEPEHVPFPLDRNADGNAYPRTSR
jgi:hypothetical protein